MKFTTHYLLALTLIVGLVCAVGRFLGLDGALGAAMLASFFLAPSILVFLLSPFHSLSVTTRQCATVACLSLLGIPATALVAFFVHPALGFFVGFFALLFWTPQLALLKDLQTA